MTQKRLPLDGNPVSVGLEILLKIDILTQMSRIDLIQFRPPAFGLQYRANASTQC